MFCPTCNTGLTISVVPMTGVTWEHCACGSGPLRHRPAASLPPAPSVTRAGSNGSVIKGMFYGTCRNPSCGAEFESPHPRQTCGATACRTYMKNRTERMDLRVCPDCQREYATRRAMPAPRCSRCQGKRYYNKVSKRPRPMLTVTCQCGKILVTPARRPRTQCTLCYNRDRQRTIRHPDPSVPRE